MFAFSNFKDTTSLRVQCNKPYLQRTNIHQKRKILLQIGDYSMISDSVLATIICNKMVSLKLLAH